jgi:leucyl-tRNA synthetase
VQLNGKRRGMMEVNASADEATIKAAALQHPPLQRWLSGQRIEKVIIAGGKLVNIVTEAA